MQWIDEYQTWEMDRVRARRILILAKTIYPRLWGQGNGMGPYIDPPGVFGRNSAYEWASEGYKALRLCDGT